jgi:hypothetical protein
MTRTRTAIRRSKSGIADLLIEAQKAFSQASITAYAFHIARDSLKKTFYVIALDPREIITKGNQTSCKNARFLTTETTLGGSTGIVKMNRLTFIWDLAPKK